MVSKHSIRFVLLALALLLLGSTAAVRAATVTPDRWLPGDDATGPAAGDQGAPAISHGGGQSLAVWADERADPHGIFYQEYETSSDIYAMRLDADGNPVDALPFPLTQAPAAQTNPQVSWNGENWLVVWEDVGLGGTGYYYSTYLRAARVSPAGVVLDATPITVFPSGSSSTIQFAIASDGANWTIALQGTGSGEGDLAAIRISPDGNRLDVTPRTLVPAEYYSRYDLRLVHANGVYLLAWEDFDDLLGIRFDQSLQVLDAAPFTLVSGNQGSVQLGANDTGFFAVWTAAPNYVNNVFGSRIDTDGTVLDPGGINISQNESQTTFTSLPEVGWDGLNWRVTWGQNGLSIARVSPAGGVLDPGGVAVPVSATGPTAVAPDGAVHMVWDAAQAYLAQSSDVYAVGVSAGFSGGPQNVLSLSAPSQTHAELAGSGNGWIVVYRSAVSGEKRIMAQPLDAGGNPVGAAPVRLDGGDSSDGPSRPNVAWNGSLYLVVWENEGSGNIVGRRLLTDGTPVDGAPFFIMTGNTPDVSALGDTFLVVGTEETIGPHFVHPFAIRVRGSDGAILDAEPFQLGQYFARWPTVVELDGRWLAVWQRNVSHDDPAASTWGAFVNADGTFTSEFLVYGYYSIAGGNGIFEVGAAAGDNAALVVQSDEVSSGVETDLVGVLVNADGTLQTPIMLTPWQGNQYRPRVAWDGGNFIVAYQEQKNRFATHTLDQLDATSDLFALRLDEAGTIIDPQGFAFSTSRLAEAHPNVAAANGVAMLAGSVLRNEAPFAAYRIGIQPFGLDGNAAPVSVAAADVTSGDAPLTVAFTSAGSTDLDGAVAGYLWDFGDGATSTAANPSHTYELPGNYVATLTVTDVQGATSTNTVAVEVAPVNVPPVAVASADTTSGPAPLSVVFRASGSYDPDGPLGNIHWEFGDGSEYWGTPAYNTYDTPGTYLVTMTVWDSRGATDSDTLTITIGGANQTPVAVADATPLTGQAPLTVAFSSAGSEDPDGSIASYAWDFGDGASSTLPDPGHTYDGAGTYVARLTVIDDFGATGSDSVTIVVEAPQMVVDSIDVVVVGTGKWKEGEATVSIVDVNGFPIGGASVAGAFTGDSSGSANGSTDANGQVALTSPKAKDGSTWQFCVTDVTKSGWAYDAGAAECSETGSGGSNTPPAVDFVDPADSATVSGAVTIRVDAFDAEDLDGSLTVEWNVDGGPWQPATYDAATNLYAALWDTTAFADGAHILNARTTDSAGEGATASRAVTVDNGSGGGTGAMYVGDLAGSATDDGGAWSAYVTITILDDADNPVTDATVAGTWNKGPTATGMCTTDAAGQCTVAQTGIGNKTPWVAFTVDDVTHATLTSDPSLNVESDVRVQRP